MRRDHVTVGPLGLLGEPLDEGGGIGDLAASLGQRLALFGGHDLRQVFLVGHDQLEPVAQPAGALLGGQAAPGRLRGLRREDGAAGFRAPHVRHAAQLVPGGRVEDVGPRAVVGLAPLAVQIGLLAEQAGVFQFHRGLRWNVRNVKQS
ncbi:hypothetical protein D3C85_972460 [compost metagenome]